MSNAILILPMRKSYSGKDYDVMLFVSFDEKFFTMLFSVIQGYHRPRHYIATQGKYPPFSLKSPCPSLEEKNELLPAKKPHRNRAGEPAEVLRLFTCLFEKEGGDKFSYRGKERE